MELKMCVLIEINIYQILYYISVIFQLTPSILLLSGYINKWDAFSLAKNIDESKYDFGEVDENSNDNCDTLKEILRCRYAFCMFIIGFGTSILAEKPTYNYWIQLVIILGFSLIIWKLLEKYISRKAEKQRH